MRKHMVANTVGTSEGSFSMMKWQPVPCRSSEPKMTAKKRDARKQLELLSA